MQTAELLPDCIRFSCCSPLASALQLLLPGPIAASASTAAPPLPPPPAAAPRLRPLHLICCSPLASASAAAPDRVHFGCYSPIALAGFQPMPGPKVLEHSSVQALAAQVEELRAAHSREASSPTCHCTHTDSEPSWVEVVKRKHSHRSGEDGERSNKLRGAVIEREAVIEMASRTVRATKGGSSLSFKSAMSLLKGVMVVGSRTCTALTN